MLYKYTNVQQLPGIGRDEGEGSPPAARTEPRQEPRGDVDDFIFAGEPWWPSER